MARSPLVLPAFAVVAGIIADAHGVALPALAAAAPCAMFRRDAAVALACGVAAGMLHGHPFAVEHALRTAQYAGTVVGDVRREDGTVTFPFALEGLGTLRAFAHGDVHAGDRLLVRARVAPVDEARNPGEPSQRALALADGIAGQIDVERVLARAPADLHDPRVWAPVARERASVIVRAALPEPDATILAGALWGERGTLPSNVRDDFQATGTVHVLVTAGLHLGVIAALCAGFFTLLRMPRIAASLATIPIVYAYAWFSGWHLPSQRAAAMLAVALAARAAGARTVSLNTLALAAIVVAVAWPVAVQSVSFALSFSCVAAIVLFAEPLAERLHRACIPARIAEALALTGATQIGVWPLTAATFFTIAPYALLANALVVPVVGIAMMLGIAMLALQPLPLAAAAVARLDAWLLAIVLMTTHAVAAFPGARMTMTPPPAWSIAAYDGCAVLAAILLRAGRMRAALAMLAAACAGVWLASTAQPRGALSITALDAGQADAIVVRTPHGGTILIDTGGRLERGAPRDAESPAERAAERTVVPYLRRAGIAHIDLMVITHPHGDHVGGCAPIVRGFSVDRILDSGQRYGGRAFRDCLQAARERHVPVTLARAGMRWSTNEGITLDVLAPSEPYFADGTNDVNENSIVALLRYCDFRALFMGDAGFQSEDRLLATGLDMHADVLKVGHHGSAYSSSARFIAAVHPRYALISAGRRNRFGHPAPSTLTTLRAAGAAVFRTDTCGALTVEATVVAAISTMLAC